MTPETKTFWWTVGILSVMLGLAFTQNRCAQSAAMSQAEPAARDIVQNAALAPAPPAPAMDDPRLIVPVAGVAPRDLVDTWAATRGEGRTHKGIDIMAAAGTAVRAAAPGRIVKLFYSDRGGLTIYQMDESRRYLFYYAHLQDYAPGLREGDEVKRGQTIALVGQTGNATTPHLHFEIGAADPEGRWWRSESFNPYPSLMAGAISPPPANAG